MASRGVLAVDPPGEVDQELVEDPAEEREVALATRGADLVDAPGRPGMHRGIDVGERPFVCRDLAVRVHVPLAQQEDELLFRELRVDTREREHVKGEIPGRVPRVLPRVRHRDHVAVEEVGPVGVARPLRGRGLGRVAVQPVSDRVVVELLRPDQTGVGLPDHRPRVRVDRAAAAGSIEGVGLCDAGGEDPVELATKGQVGTALVTAKTDPNDRRLAAGRARARSGRPPSSHAGPG